MILECAGCHRKLMVTEFVEQAGCDYTVKLEMRGTEEPGLCPRCALEWFKRLARGEKAEWVTRGKR